MFSTPPRAHDTPSTYLLLSLVLLSHRGDLFWGDLVFLIFNCFSRKYLLILCNTRHPVRSFMLLKSCSVRSRLWSLHIMFRVSLTGQEVPAEAEHRPNSLNFPWHKSYQCFRNYYQKIKIKSPEHILSSLFCDLKEHLEQKILTCPLYI